MEYGHSLLAFKKDIELSDRIETQLSFMPPLYKYYGVLGVDHEALFFSGADKKNGEPFELVIKIVEITGIHLGYDHTFKKHEDHSPGAFHLVPLRIDFISLGKEESIYVFANYSNLMRHSDNQKLYDELSATQGYADIFL